MPEPHESDDERQQDLFPPVDPYTEPTDDPFEDVFKEAKRMDDAVVEERPRRKKPKPEREAPPDFDIQPYQTQLESYARDTPWHEAQQQAGAIANELNRLPPQRNYSDDELLSMSETQKRSINQLEERRRHLEWQRNELLPREAQLKQQANVATATQIQGRWQDAMRDYGAHAQKVIDRVRNLPADQQLRKETYDLVYDAMRGEELRAKEKKRAVRNSTQMAGRSRGGAGESASPMSRQERGYLENVFGEGIAKVAHKMRKAQVDLDD